MKYAIIATQFLANAVADMLDDNGYDMKGDSFEGSHILINTDKRTYKYADDNNGRTELNPTTSWAAIAATITGTTGGSQAAAPLEATNVAVTANGLRVGDQVRATNSRKTKPNFRLDTSRVYTVARITAKGNVGLEGLPNDEYLAARFSKVGTTTGNVAAATTGATSGVRATPVAAAPVANTPAIDAAGNTLRVGDVVLTITANPGRRDRKFVLPANGVKTITEITAKGSIGFGGADQYAPKRFQKVTLSPAADNVVSGDLVVAKARKDSRFPLPVDTALTFRGVTVEGGNYILDGYTRDQYAKSRFQKVTKVGTAR